MLNTYQRNGEQYGGISPRKLVGCVRTTLAAFILCAFTHCAIRLVDCETDNRSKTPDRRVYTYWVGGSIRLYIVCDSI